MQKLAIKNKEFEIIKNLKKSDQYNVFLCNFSEKKYRIVKYIEADAFFADLKNYKFLKRAGIEMPKLKIVDKKNFTLVFEWIDAIDVLEYLSQFDLPEIYYEKLFLYYRFARFSQFELNYLPENFVFKNKKLYYVSLEKIPANPQLNLENYGIFYWVMSEENAEHMKALKLKFEESRVLKSAEAKKKIVLLSVMNW